MEVDEKAYRKAFDAETDPFVKRLFRGVVEAYEAAKALNPSNSTGLELGTQQPAWRGLNSTGEDKHAINSLGMKALTALDCKILGNPCPPTSTDHLPPLEPPDHHETKLFSEIHWKCREEMWAYTLHFNEASGSFDFSVSSLAPAEDFGLSDSSLPYILQEIDIRRQGHE